MNPYKVTLEITTNGWTYRVFAGETLIAEHEMRRAPMGWRGVVKGDMTDKLPESMAKLGEAIEDGSPDEIANALEGF